MEKESNSFLFPSMPVEEIKREVLPLLKHLRDEYSDEIPERILHSDDPGGSPRYKCRTSWFNNVVNMIRPIMSQIRDPLYSDCLVFSEYMKSALDWAKPRTREEIRMATYTLVRVITYIETEM